MDQATHNKIVSFIWGIADDVLRDLFRRGKYPDVILPMFVIRRMDAVLEPTKQTVLDTRKMLDEARITEQRAALAAAAGQSFYNTSRFTLRDLKSRGSQQQLLVDFEDYLNGFSPNVQDILENFKFRNQLTTLSRADALGTLINKFLDPEIDLSPAGIDNHSMGTVFEELVRRFNEENNEEAGEHWTPRDAVRLSWRVETAPPVIARMHKPGKAKSDQLHGLFDATVDGKAAIVEYDPDPDLRDTEQVPLLEEGGPRSEPGAGIEAFIRREVLPYTPDAWVDASRTRIGYEVSFTRHFYKPQPLRTLEEIRADIFALEKETEGLLSEIIGSAS